MKFKIFLAITFAVFLFGCGGGGGGNEEATIPSSIQTPSAAPVNTGMYPAPDGKGQSRFVDITLAKQSYIDTITFKATVGLHDLSLNPLIENLSGSNLIPAGSYKIKIAYAATSNLPGNVTIYSATATPVNTLKEFKSGRFDANGSLGTYAEYYKLNLSENKNIDITTFKANVYLIKTSEIGENFSPSESFAEISGTKSLTVGQYLVKIVYQGTSNAPGSVTTYIQQ